MSKKENGLRSHHAATARHTRMLCTASLLTALSLLLGLIAKTLQGEAPLRFTLEGLPIVLSGMVLGPVYGALVGVAADLLSCPLSGQSPLPLITVGAAIIGLLPGILSPFFYRRTPLTAARPRFSSILLCDGVGHAVGSILTKTAALARFHGVSVVILIPWRLPLYLGIIMIESYLLYILLGSTAIRRELERLVKK